MNYVFYVDESGDQGLDKVRGVDAERGSTPFFTLGASLVPVSRKSQLEDRLAEITQELNGKALHCSEMTHYQKAYFSRQVGAMGVLLFGLISKKETLGAYKTQIEGEGQAELYYNKCSHYLLELLGKFLEKKKISQERVSIVFEQKRHNYQRLRGYIRQIRETPKDSRAIYLRRVDPLSITSAPKKSEPLLALADLTAHALFQSVNSHPDNYFVPEQRYFREIKSRFWHDDATGAIANYGIKYVSGPVKMGLTGVDLDFALSMYPPKK